MRTRYWLILAVGILTGFCAHADTIKLKDGTTLEGEIVSEDDSTVSILLEFAGGTITQTRQINKTDVADIARWTPEQKAEHKTDRDYEDLQKYKLSPTTSYPVEYYDQVIQNAFRKFITDHPGSPYTSNIIERAGQWIAERDLVAGGKAKYHGRWVPASEIDFERGSQWLQQGRASLSRGNPELAIQQVRPILSMQGQTGLVSQAKTLLTSAYLQSLADLNLQSQQLPDQIASAQQRATQAQQAVNQANASIKQAMNSAPAIGSIQDVNGGSSYQALGGNGQKIFQNQNALNKAQADLRSAQSQVADLQRRLADVNQRTAILQSQATALKIKFTEGGTSTASSPVAGPTVTTPTTGDSSPVLSDMMVLIREKWWVLVLAAAVAIYLLSRLTKAQ